jgi:hypothetical protein
MEPGWTKKLPSLLQEAIDLLLECQSFQLASESLEKQSHLQSEAKIALALIEGSGPALIGFAISSLPEVR